MGIGRASGWEGCVKGKGLRLDAMGMAMFVQA